MQASIPKLDDIDVPVSPTSPLSPTSTERKTPIFSLIIGINKYASDEFQDLKAAVGDANSFERFLVEQLNVPKSHIISLRDEQATRAKIIDGFAALRDIAAGQPRDVALIIYYAGHGARIEKPVEWEDWSASEDQIEMLCPHDIGVPATDKDGVEGVIQGIPDRTISVLLNHLSDIRGDNITLILDCCSSAGINRGEADYVARQILNPPPLSANCDRGIWSRETGARGVGVAEGFSGKFHASHVLLAACGRDQSAWEDSKSGQGLFTQSLLKLLGRRDVESLTYTSLMHNLKMPVWQTPHCEGQYVNRRLFNSRALGADASFMLTKAERDGTITLQAGAAQGITVGCKFSAHASNLIEDATHTNPSLGTLIARSVNAFTTDLALPEGASSFKHPRLFYSRLTEQVSDSKITVYGEDKAWVESIFSPEYRQALNLSIADKAADADIVLSVVDEKVYFDRNDKWVNTHIGSRLAGSVDVDDFHFIREVVRCSRHFYYHLTRQGPDDFRNVWMELKYLHESLTKDYDIVMTPIGRNLIDEEPATITVDLSHPETRLGMTIFNQTDLPLYPYLFYFDPSDLSIIEWFTPAFGAGAGSLTTRTDAPLPSKSQLSIGYGDGGVPPWEFMFREGDTKDIGFFKLFLSTSPTYFSVVLQKSPFEENVSRYGKPSAPQALEAERWGTKMATIIQVASSNT